MRLDTNLHAVQHNGLGDTRQGYIADHGFIFGILSDAIYQDKEVAIMREVGSNCLDAHIMAGRQDEPFVVHLPNYLDPELRFRDFGPGLSHEAMMTYYVGYGASDKRHTNDLIGGLGLGCKSPLSKVPQFTVCSYQGGEKRTYIVHKQADGVPACSLMLTEPTSEPDGLEVIVPVDRGDFHAYREAAQKVFAYFPVKPTIEGDSYYSHKEIEYISGGDGWGLRPSVSYIRADPRAIMGVVAYPINIDALGDLTPAQKALLDLPIDIRFPVGALSVLASREGLQYKPETQARIKQRLDEVSRDLTHSYEEMFAACPTLWEAKVLFQEKVEYGGLSHGLRKLLEQRLTYDGEPISDSVVVAKFHHDTSIGLIHLAPWQMRRRNLDLNGYWRLSFNANRDTIFLWDPQSTPVLGKLLKHNYPNGATLVIIRTPDQALFERAIAQFGNPPWITTADLDPLPKGSYSRSRSQVRKMLRYDSGQWVTLDRDEEAGGLYVDLHSGVPQWNGQPWPNFEDWVLHARQLGLLTAMDGPIIGIQATYKHIPRKFDGWTPLSKLLEERARKLLDEQGFNEHWANWLEENAHSETEFFKVTLLLEDFVHAMKPRAKMRRLIEGIQRLRANRPLRLVAMHSLALCVGYKIKEVKPAADLGKLLDEARNQYPMLHLLARNVYSIARLSTDETRRVILDYVNANR